MASHPDPHGHKNSRGVRRLSAGSEGGGSAVSPSLRQSGAWQGGFLRPEVARRSSRVAQHAASASSQPSENSTVSARVRWQRAGRRICLVVRAARNLRDAEPRIRRRGRVLSHLVADHVFIWPFRDVRFRAVFQPFSLYFRLASLKQTLILWPLHLIEDLCESFHETRDMIDSASTSSRALTEAILGVVSWPLYAFHTRALFNLPMGHPSTWFCGVSAHMASIAPFIGGLRTSPVSQHLQGLWLLTLCKPLDVLALTSARNGVHELQAARQIYCAKGLCGFFSGTAADIRVLLSVMLSHFITARRVPRKTLLSALACNVVVLKFGNVYLKELAYMGSMAIATSILKTAVNHYFGVSPIKAHRDEVRFTKEFLQSKAIAIKLARQLATNAALTPLKAQVDLNRSWDKRLSLELAIRPSLSVLTRNASQLFERGSSLVSSCSQETPPPEKVFMSGLMDDLLGINGSFELYNAVTINRRPVYRKDVGDDSYLYLLHDDWQKWVLTGTLISDPPYIVAYCVDMANLPHHCAAVWQVADRNGFVKDGSVKVSKEPTLFLRRMAVFATLNAMIEEDGENSAGDLEKAVNPAERFLLQVHRQSLAKSSLLAVLGAHPAELVAREFAVRFHNEEGLDYGGVRREWFSQLAIELVECKSLELALWDKTVSFEGGMFELAPDQSLLPRPISVDVFVALGRLLAMALIHEAAFPLPLCSVVYKYILNVSVNATDLRALDPEFYEHRLASLLAQGGADKLEELLGEPLTFVSAASSWGTGGKPLVPGGEKKVVTERNKMEFACKLAEDYLCGNIRHQLQALVTGFWDLCPLKALKSIDFKDLQALIMGPTTPLDVKALKKSAKLQPEKSDLPQFEWFFEAVDDLDPDEGVRFVQFFSGSSRIPEGGLRPPFTLVVNDAWDQMQLPIAHTCANMVCMPAYATESMLRLKLHQAVLNHVGFGFA